MSISIDEIVDKQDKGSLDLLILNPDDVGKSNISWLTFNVWGV